MIIFITIDICECHLSHETDTSMSNYLSNWVKDVSFQRTQVIYCQVALVKVFFYHRFTCLINSFTVTDEYNWLYDYHRMLQRDDNVEYKIINQRRLKKQGRRKLATGWFIFADWTKSWTQGKEKETRKCYISHSTKWPLNSSHVHSMRSVAQRYKSHIHFLMMMMQ